MLWIGGASGAGKTTVGGRLARRWGLRLYSCDTRTWEHRDRAVAAGVEAAIRFYALGPEARLAEPVESRRDMELVAEREAMVLDDLSRLPPSPLVLAEGTLLPAASADPGRSVWLVPSVEFQSRHRTRERTIFHPIEEKAGEAALRGIPVIVVDGTRPVADIVEEVEHLLAAPLVAGPSAPDSRPLLREANLAVVEQIRVGCTRAGAAAAADSRVATFLCECGNPRCEATRELPVGVAAAGPVLADGHRSAIEA